MARRRSSACVALINMRFIASPFSNQTSLPTPFRGPRCRARLRSGKELPEWRRAPRDNYLGGRLQGAWTGARQRRWPRWGRPLGVAAQSAATDSAREGLRAARSAGAGMPPAGCHSIRLTICHRASNTGVLASIRPAARVCQACIPFHGFEVLPRPPARGDAASVRLAALRPGAGRWHRPSQRGVQGEWTKLPRKINHLQRSASETHYRGPGRGARSLDGAGRRRIGRPAA